MMDESTSSIYISSVLCIRISETIKKTRENNEKIKTWNFFTSMNSTETCITKIFFKLFNF